MAPSFVHFRPVPTAFALFTTTTTTAATDPTSHHPHAPPSLRIRFISTWLPACLPPSQSHDSKASRSLLNPLHSHSLFLFPNTASIRTLALPEDADTTHPNAAPVPPESAKSRPQIRSSKIQPIRHPWSPIVPSPLRRYSSRPFCPSSLFTSQTAIWLLCQIPPRPLSLCTRLYRPLLQMDAPSELTPQV